MHTPTLTHPLRTLLLLAGALIFSFTGPAPAHADWTSAHHRDHPLVGTIWSTETEGPLTETAYLDRMAAARFVLLGEIHPNPDHHNLQAQALEELIKRGRKPAVVFEMIPINMQKAVDTFIAQEDRSLDLLQEVLQWTTRGWPDWSMYAPIFDLALRHDLPIRAGNLSKSESKGLWKDIKAGLSDDQKRLYGLDVPLGDTVQSQLRSHIGEAHCGMLPEKMLDPMTSVQRAKDGLMANTLMDADQGDGAVLISGSGHVRRDWAVPFVIKAKQPKAEIVAVAFSEASPGYKTAKDYMPDAAPGAPIFDILYFTPLAEKRDYCADLKKHFKHKKKN